MKHFLVLLALGLLSQMKGIAQQNVGIGTNSPSERLQVNGNIRMLQRNGSMIMESPGELLGTNLSHNIGITFTRSNNWVGSIRHVQPATPNASTPPVIRFSNSAENADDMVIDNQGRVGIGIRNPGTRLEVDGNVTSRGTLFVASNNATLQLRAADNINKGFFQLNGDVVRLGTSPGNTSNLVFRLNGSDRAVINSSGNMGIGTTSPSSRLDVAGRVRVVQNGEALALDGNQPNIGFWFNGAYRSFISQSATNLLYIGVNAGNLRLDATGHVAIGNVVATTNEFKLTVSGKVLCEELRVRLQSAWPDYVFGEQYKLMPLDQLGRFIQENKHLPNIPAASEMEEAGLEVGEMQRRMMEKIEELTLYILELKKDNDKLKAIIENK